VSFLTQMAGWCCSRYGNATVDGTAELSNPSPGAQIVDIEGKGPARKSNEARSSAYTPQSGRHGPSTQSFLDLSFGPYLHPHYCILHRPNTHRRVPQHLGPPYAPSPQGEMQIFLRGHLHTETMAYADGGSLEMNGVLTLKRNGGLFYIDIFEYYQRLLSPEQPRACHISQRSDGDLN
jgi:hypothetical protein